MLWKLFLWQIYSNVFFVHFLPEIIGAWQSKIIFIKFLSFGFFPVCCIWFLKCLDDKMMKNEWKTFLNNQNVCRCAFEMRKLLSLNLQFVIISNKSNFLRIEWMICLMYLMYVIHFVSNVSNSNPILTLPLTLNLQS